MENIVNKLEVTEAKPNKIVLDNRKHLEITGISKVISVNETNACVIVNSTKLYIDGEDLSIEKLDVNEGVLILSGNVNEIKYSGKDVKNPLFRRIFK